jgi:hypothetical protein
VLDEITLIREVNESRGNDFVSDMTEYVTGQTVVTQYNNRTYKIDGLRFDLSPGSFFEFQGSKITFCEYMFKRYKLAVKVLG